MTHLPTIAVFGESMTKVPDNLYYTKEHEWLKEESEGIVTIGITDYAQNALTDIVYIELPERGQKVEHNEEFAIVESVKSASSIFAPLSGTIIDINDELDSSPELMNNSPYEEGWIIKMKLTSHDQISNLMSSDDYEKLIE